MFDLIISGGTVVDGSGGKSRRADVAINGDKIVGVGDYSNKASTRTVDASGCLVSPGRSSCSTYFRSVRSQITNLTESKASQV